MCANLSTVPCEVPSHFVCSSRQCGRMPSTIEIFTKKLWRNLWSFGNSAPASRIKGRPKYQHKEHNNIFEAQKEIEKAMRQRDMLEFRTPQHPSSLGSNTWGGASPLLARNIPKESLEQKYLRLNTIRVRDEIFPDAEEAESMDYLPSKSPRPKQECPPTPSRRKRFLLKIFLSSPMPKAATLGSKKRSWFPRLDPQNRWPQGWC